MTIEEMKDLCRDRIAKGGECIVVVIPRMPTGNGIRLTTCGGPIGEVLCVNAEGHTVARFKAKAVLKWLEENA